MYILKKFPINASATGFTINFYVIPNNATILNLYRAF